MKYYLNLSKLQKDLLIYCTLTDHIKEYIRNIITGSESEEFINRPKHALNVYRNSTDIVTKWKKLFSVTFNTETFSSLNLNVNG